MAVFGYFALYHVLLIDVGSAVYASLVVLFIDDQHSSLWPLWIAKYNGFSINLAVSLLLLCVLKNLKKFGMIALPWLRYKNIVEYRLGCPRLTLNRSHALYTYRVLVAAILHTLSHALFTHPYRLNYDETFQPPIITVDTLLLNHRPAYAELPFHEQARVVVSSFFGDSYTWTGYTLLLVLCVPLLLTGLRLARLAPRHFVILQMHRLFALVSLPLIILHHSIYFWPTFWLVLVLMDYLLGWLLFTEICTVHQCHRYPNYQLEDEQQQNDVIDVSFRYAFERLENFQPGDYVRVKMPRISRLEWHDFTLMRCETRTVFESRVHLTVRSVGRWTQQLYRLAKPDSVLIVKGPYSVSMYDPLMHRIMLSDVSRFDSGGDDDANARQGETACFLSFNLRSIRMPRTLVLACTGTAITHFLSILDALIPLYYNGYRYDELPQQIVICWNVRTIFNLNFALIPLARYQRMLASSMLSDLLVYEFFVSQRPNNSDALCAQAFRRMLLATTTTTTKTKTTSVSNDDNDSPLMLRNSRLSMLDIVQGERSNTILGNRINYESFGERHLRGGADTLLIVNTSIRAVQNEFKRLAVRHKCPMHTESLF